MLNYTILWNYVIMRIKQNYTIILSQRRKIKN